MNNKQRLKKLKQFKINDIQNSFSTHKEWNEWADNVAPLLKYDPDHYSNFVTSLQYIRIEKLSAATIVPHLHNMAGIVRQAIIELENKIESYWSLKAVKNIWHDSFWGKVLVSITSATIMIFIGSLIAIYALPSFQKLAAPKEQQQQLSRKQPNTSEGASNIQDMKQLSEK